MIISDDGLVLAVTGVTFETVFPSLAVVMFGLSSVDVSFISSIGSDVPPLTSVTFAIIEVPMVSSLLLELDVVTPAEVNAFDSIGRVVGVVHVFGVGECCLFNG